MSCWQTKPLGDLVTFLGGGTPRRDRPDYWGGDIPWASVKDLQSQSLETTLENITAEGLANSASNLIPEGTVIIASRVGLGKVAINCKPVAINQDLKALTPRTDELLPRYLLLFLLSNAEHFARTGVGATVKGLTIADYQKLKIAVPPLIEQGRIVKMLGEADELRKLRAQADRCTTSLLPALFHEMFEAQERIQGWRMCKLSELCDSADDIRCGPFGTQLLRSEYQRSGVPLWNIKHVNSHFALPANDFLTKAKASDLSNYSLLPGDIVMTRKATVGNCSVYPNHFEPGVMHSDLLRIRVSKASCTPDFLSFALAFSIEVKQQVDAISAGATTQGINVSMLKRIAIHVPPLLLQKEFAKRATKIRDLEAAQAASRRRVDDLFQSMLHRAFDGEL